MFGQDVNFSDLDARDIIPRIFQGYMKKHTFHEFCQNFPNY